MGYRWVLVIWTEELTQHMGPCSCLSSSEPAQLLPTTNLPLFLGQITLSSISTVTPYLRNFRCLFKSISKLKKYNIFIFIYTLYKYSIFFIHTLSVWCICLFVLCSLISLVCFLVTKLKNSCVMPNKEQEEEKRVRFSNSWLCLFFFSLRDLFYDSH